MASAAERPDRVHQGPRHEPPTIGSALTAADPIAPSPPLPSPIAGPALPRWPGAGGDPEPPRIAGYEVAGSGPIASGGMGQVWRARRLADGRAVAIKVGRPGAPLEYFRREIECLRALDHPNIVRYLDDGMFEGSAGPAPYLVMEYVFDARSITRYAWENKLGVRERLELFLQACAAVECLHRARGPGGRGWVHRDLKPENIQVAAQRPSAAEGGAVSWPRGRVKLLDVGIATPVEPDPALFERALERGAAGTMEYMAPEQFIPGGEAVDERTDLYALGVVLHELLTAGSPYPAEKQHRPAVRWAIENHELVGPARVAARMSRAVRKRGRTPGWFINPVACDGELEAIVLRALGHGRAQRFASIDAGAGDQDLAVNIRALLTGELPPILKGTSYETPHRARRALRTKRWPGAWSRWVYGLALLAGALTGVMTAKLSGALEGLTAGWQRLAVSSIPPPANERILIIEMRAETDEAAVARFAGLANLSAPGSMRGVWGAFLEHLARLGPGVVILDHSYGVPTSFDAALIRGVEALKSAGRSVIVDGTGWFDDREAGLPIQCPLHAHVVWGRSGAETPPDAPWTLHLGLKRGDEVRPSMALQAAQHFRRPPQTLEFAMEPGRAEIIVKRPDAAAERISGSALEEVAEGTANPATGVAVGDLILHDVITLPPGNVITARTIDLADFLTQRPDQRRRLVDNSVVVLKDTRTAEDAFVYFNRDRVGGWQALGSATGQLLRGWRLPVHDSAPVEALALATAGLLGLLAMNAVLALVPIDRLLPRRAVAVNGVDPAWAARATARWALVTGGSLVILAIVIPPATLAASVASGVLFFPHGYLMAAFIAAGVGVVIALARRRTAWEPR